jgi:hypothetical protein
LRADVEPLGSRARGNVETHNPPARKKGYLENVLRQPRKRLQEQEQETKRQAAARKTHRVIRNSVVLPVVERQKALKDNVIKITPCPANIGGAFTRDVRSLFAKAFLHAKI